VIVRMQRGGCLTWQAHEFEAAMAQYFVDVHVGGGAGAALKHIDRKTDRAACRR